MVNALVTSSFDYCNTLYMKLPLKMVWKLQLVQNAVIDWSIDWNGLEDPYYSSLISYILASNFMDTGFQFASIQGAGIDL